MTGTSMTRPLLIDTDMGVDDAVAVTLALAANDVEVAGIVSVGGNVSLDQATTNIGRLIHGLNPGEPVVVGRGLDQRDITLQRASHVFGDDGFGGVDLAKPDEFSPLGHREAYERLIEQHGEELVIVAIGPLTNLADVLTERPGLLNRAGQIVIMGGAVWCPGNATPHAEFNFYRDPAAAQAVISSGLPITLLPLDVTRQVAMDESHVAHLSRSGTRSGELLAQMIRYPLEREGGAGPHTFIVHDSLAVGVLLWPELFMRAKMALEIVTSGEEVGRSRPLVAKGRQGQIRVVISVNAGEFLDNLLEDLCHERFVV